MRKYLLPHTGNFYKANLHCHTNISDGRCTPEQIKEIYKANGYSVVAYTDHEVFITHNELKDEVFLPLNGYEIGIKEKNTEGRPQKVCHICLVSLNENKKTQNIMFENRFIQRNSDKLCYDDTKALTVGEYSAEFISKIMEQASNDEFFVTYNHPVWSMETQNEYCNYHGMNAMEILNYGCVTEGYDDRNGYIYDQILRGGEKIYCIATDDNHNKFPVGDPKFDSFGGFTMIKAEALEYSAIAEALKKGYFYSSEGPGIKELYFEDDKIYIETTDASRIVMTTANRKYRVVTAENVGEILNSACFDIQADYGDYIRFTVTDLNGKEAYTNAYYISELSLNRI